MKLIHHNKNIYVIRLDRGDELKTSLINFCTEHNIASAHVSGIGSTDDCILAYYDPDKKNYIDHSFSGQHEVISIMGNITIYNGNILPHLHVTISDKDLRPYSGHVQKLVTFITNEIILHAFDDTITRTHFEEDNLYLLT